MPPKKIKFVCTDKIPLPQGQIRNKPGICFKSGLRAGFAAGIQKGTKNATKVGLKKQVKMNIIGQDNIKLGAQRMAIKRNVAVINRRRAFQAQQQAQQRENAQMGANDVNIQPPRVKPAGRKQKFRNFYGLDRAAEVVVQNPVAALPAPIVNIWDRVNRMGGKAQRGEAPTGGARNRDELIAELVKNEPDLPDRNQGVSTLKKLGKRVLINLLVGTGKYERGRENVGNK